MCFQNDKLLNYFLLKYIPDANGSLYGCSNNGRTLNVAFLKILTVTRSDSDFTKERKLCAEAAFIKVLKTRVLDADFQRQIDQHIIHVCEVHFIEEDITGRKVQLLFLLS